MIFMVVERFKPGAASEIYRRFRERGRLMPPNVSYVASWVDLDFRRCFQVMEAPSDAELKTWSANWEDLADFEFVPVRISADAAKLMSSTP